MEQGGLRGTKFQSCVYDGHMTQIPNLPASAAQVSYLTVLLTKHDVPADFAARCASRIEDGTLARHDAYAAIDWTRSRPLRPAPRTGVIDLRAELAEALGGTWGTANGALHNVPDDLADLLASALHPVIARHMRAARADELEQAAGDQQTGHDYWCKSDSDYAIGRADGHGSATYRLLDRAAEIRTEQEDQT